MVSIKKLSIGCTNPKLKGRIAWIAFWIQIGNMLQLKEEIDPFLFLLRSGLSTVAPS